MSGTVADVIRVAEGELGNTNGAKYFAAFDTPDLGPWCVAFVRWCMSNAGVGFDWHTWYAWDWSDAPDPIAPRDLQSGDAVSFDWDEDGGGDHVGIVKSVHDWGITTIEGNTSGGVVAERQRAWGVVVCGIRPAYRHAQQDAGEPRNDLGMRYRAHTQNVGWLATVHDGQAAGITGESLRMEAVAIEPPEGVVLDAFAHVQDVGTLGEPSIEHGHARVLGTTGRGKRLEAVMLRVVQDSIATKGHPLRVQAHVQDVGWLDPVGAGEWAGTIGEGRRLEAIRIWFE